jgi:hypothetical protein
MPRCCANPVDRLCKSWEQVSGLCTISTTQPGQGARLLSFPTAKATGFAQILVSFTQAFLCNSNLLSRWLCPVSTGPINITNLIKE